MVHLTSLPPPNSALKQRCTGWETLDCTVPFLALSDSFNDLVRLVCPWLSFPTVKMALITMSCFLRKGYEDKLVLAGEESCRASRIGRRQACSLLQVLSITYVSHSPPWLLLTMYPFSSCKWPACILISNIVCTDYRAISPSIALPSEADGFTVVRVKSWPQQCQQSQDLIPGFPLQECFLFCTKAGYGVTAAVSF